MTALETATKKMKIYTKKGDSGNTQLLGGKNVKKKKRIYDGRTREGKKFVERILARRAARQEQK